MRKILFLLSISLLEIVGLIADCYDGAPEKFVGSHWPSYNNWDIDLGFRKDRLKWGIAGCVLGPGGVPVNLGLLSEMQWKDLRIVQVSGSGRYVSNRNYAVKISGDYGHIYHGHSVETHYAGPSKTLKFSQINAHAGKGFVYDLSGAVGYRVTSTYERAVGTFLIGYSASEQSLHSYNGKSIVCVNPISGLPCPIGTLEGLNNTYKAQWYGPWIGLDFDVRVERCAYLFGGFEWHLASYRGVGRWNLRTDMGPFRQKAHGHGYIATLGTSWEIWRNISLGIVAHYRNFQTRGGSERITYIFPDERSVVVPVHFNGTKWVSYDLSGLIAWRF